MGHYGTISIYNRNGELIEVLDAIFCIPLSYKYDNNTDVYIVAFCARGVGGMAITSPTGTDTPQNIKYIEIQKLFHDIIIKLVN